MVNKELAVLLISLLLFLSGCGSDDGSTSNIQSEPNNSSGNGGVTACEPGDAIDESFGEPTVVLGAEFPDPSFAACLQEKITRDKLTDLSQIDSLTCGSASSAVPRGDIKSIEGIDGLTNLQFLNIWKNRLSYADLSRNPAIMRLDLDVNNLTCLDLRQNTQLLTIWIHLRAWS